MLNEKVFAEVEKWIENYFFVEENKSQINVNSSGMPFLIHLAQTLMVL